METTTAAVLNVDQRQQANNELGESDEIRGQQVSAVRQWAEEQVTMNLVLDDISILWFLRGCKFDMAKTKTRIENFSSFRSRVPEWYSNRDPANNELAALIKSGLLLPIPGRDHKGRTVFLIRACRHDPYKHSQDNVFKVMNMVIDLHCRDDEATSISGVVAVIDLKGAGLGHATSMTPSMIRKAVNSWQDVTPIRTKQMYFINTPYNVHLVLNIFKKFMKEKLRQRVHLHRDGRVALQDLIPIDNLPEDFGGRGLSINSLSDRWAAHMTNNRQWFVDVNAHGPFGVAPNEQNPSC